MECKRKSARENRMHEDDNKHSIKEMECEKRKENKMHEKIKCMKEIKDKMQRGVQAVIWGVQELKKDIGPKRERGALMGFRG